MEEVEEAGVAGGGGRDVAQEAQQGRVSWALRRPGGAALERVRRPVPHLGSLERELHMRKLVINHLCLVCHVEDMLCTILGLVRNGVKAKEMLCQTRNL